MPELTQTRGTMIAGVLQGEEAEWEKFYRKYGILAVYLGRYYHIPEQDLGELTSQAMQKFWASREKFTYDPERKFRAYFASVVHSVAMDMHRRHGRGSLLVEWPVDADGRPMEFAAPGEVRKIIEAEDAAELYLAARNELQEMVPDLLKYQCWQLHYEEGWPMKRIVEYLGAPQSTVYWNCNEVATLLQRIYCRLTRQPMPLPQKKSTEKADSTSQHIAEEKILQYISQDCGILERRRIEKHLAKCQQCRDLEKLLRQRDGLQHEIVQGFKEHLPMEQVAEKTTIPVMTQITRQAQERRLEQQ